MRRRLGGLVSPPSSWHHRVRRDIELERVTTRTPLTFDDAHGFLYFPPPPPPCTQAHRRLRRRRRRRPRLFIWGSARRRISRTGLCPPTARVVCAIHSAPCCSAHRAKTDNATRLTQDTQRGLKFRWERLMPDFQHSLFIAVSRCRCRTVSVTTVSAQGTGRLCHCSWGLCAVIARQAQEPGRRVFRAKEWAELLGVGTADTEK